MSNLMVFLMESSILKKNSSFSNNSKTSLFIIQKLEGVKYSIESSVTCWFISSLSSFFSATFLLLIIGIKFIAFLILLSIIVSLYNLICPIFLTISFKLYLAFLYI